MSLRTRLQDTTFRITLPGLRGRQRSWTVRSFRTHGIPHPERGTAVVPRRDTIVDYRPDARDDWSFQRRTYTFAPRARRGSARGARRRSR